MGVKKRVGEILASELADQSLFFFLVRPWAFSERHRERREKDSVELWPLLHVLPPEIAFTRVHIHTHGTYTLRLDIGTARSIN